MLSQAPEGATTMDVFLRKLAGLMQHHVSTPCRISTKPTSRCSQNASQSCEHFHISSFLFQFLALPMLCSSLPTAFKFESNLIKLTQSHEGAFLCQLRVS